MFKKFSGIIFLSIFLIGIVSGVSDGPILLLHFDEGIGTTASDSSDYHYNGIIHDAIWTSGISGTALQLNGKGYVDINLPQSPLNAFTIETWIKTSTPQIQTIFGGAIEDNKYAPNLFVGSDGQLSGCVNKGGAYILSIKNVGDGNWHHIVFVASDEGTTSTNIRLYVDGILDTEQTDSFPIQWTSPHSIGKRASEHYFVGFIDEFAVYPRALTNNEIQSHYVKGLNGQPSTPIQTTAPQPPITASITFVSMSPSPLEKGFLNEIFVKHYWIPILILILGIILYIFFSPSFQKGAFAIFEDVLHGLLYGGAGFVIGFVAVTIGILVGASIDLFNLFFIGSRDFPIMLWIEQNYTLIFLIFVAIGIIFGLFDISLFPPIPIDKIPVDTQLEPEVSRYIPSEVKQRVWERDGGRCVQCNSKRNLEFDHIIPVSKGGSNSENNVQLLCQKCNREKSNKIQ
ncbi:MAG: HNH endonuclease [Patescibacteria group bacterium]|nr:HNH endonuclease [Patescibacteria group bacterium]